MTRTRAPFSQRAEARAAAPPVFGAASSMRAHARRRSQFRSIMARGNPDAPRSITRQVSSAKPAAAFLAAPARAASLSGGGYIDCAIRLGGRAFAGLIRTAQERGFVELWGCSGHWKQSESVMERSLCKVVLVVNRFGMIGNKSSVTLILISKVEL